MRDEWAVKPDRDLWLRLLVALGPWSCRRHADGLWPRAVALCGECQAARQNMTCRSLATAPGQISLRSLLRSKCVRVVVVSRRPALVLATIFSGRLSIRLFGQREVRFVVPGRRVVCIPVPLRAHTFNVRTPLSFALGYRLGTSPAPRGPRPRPVIRRIRLVP